MLYYPLVKLRILLLCYSLGTKSDGENVWNEVTDNAQQITIKQLPLLLSKLDKIADKVPEYQHIFNPSSLAFSLINLPTFSTHSVSMV
jgi:hypothetical protein